MQISLLLVFLVALVGAAGVLAFSVLQFQVAPSLSAGALVALALVYFVGCVLGAAAMVWGVFKGAEK